MLDCCCFQWTPHVVIHKKNSPLVYPARYESLRLLCTARFQGSLSPPGTEEHRDTHTHWHYSQRNRKNLQIKHTYTHTHTPKNVYILVQLRARDKLYICIHVYTLNAPRRMEMGQRNTPKNRGWYYLLPIYNVHMYLVNNKIIINNSNLRWRNEERAAPQQRQNDSDSERAILNTNWIDYHHQQSSSSCQIWRLSWPFWFHPNRNSNHSYPHHHHAYVQWRTMTAIHGLRVGWARRIAHMAW